MTQQITPELRQWIVDQAQAGHSAESVLQSMKASGWDEDVAIEAMESTLRGNARLKLLVRGCALGDASCVDRLCVRGGCQLARQEKITRVAVRYLDDLALFARSFNVLFQ